MASVILHHLALACQDPAAMERFYSKYFGFKPARVIPIDGGQIVFMQAGGVRIECFQANQQARLQTSRHSGPVQFRWDHPGLAHGLDIRSGRQHR